VLPDVEEHSSEKIPTIVASSAEPAKVVPHCGGLEATLTCEQ